MTIENETNENHEAVQVDEAATIEPAHEEGSGSDGTFPESPNPDEAMALAPASGPLTQLVALAKKWRDTGSRYRTECARQMLAIFSVELPELPPAPEEMFDSHIKIPVGGLVADLDDKLRKIREELIISARRLGSSLLTLADSLESGRTTSVSPYGIVGEAGTNLDRICARYTATKELRQAMGRVAFHQR